MPIPAPPPHPPDANPQCPRQAALCPSQSCPPTPHLRLTRQAGAFVAQLPGLAARATVEALGGRAGCVETLAQGPREAGGTLAAEGARGVEAGAPMAAHARLAALIHIPTARAALVAWRARAVVAPMPVGAACPVGTGAGCTRIWQGAVLPCWGRRGVSPGLAVRGPLGSQSPWTQPSNALPGSQIPWIQPGSAPQRNQSYWTWPSTTPPPPTSE